MSFLAQTKTKANSFDQQQEVLQVKEWDIGVQKTMITLRFQGPTILKDDNGDETPKDGISFKQIVRTYSSNSNLQGSLERQQLRSSSSQSDDKMGAQQQTTRTKELGEEDYFSDTVQVQLNEKYMYNINWNRFFDS